MSCAAMKTYEDSKVLELEIAEDLVESLEAGVCAESVTEDDETIRIRLRAIEGWKLSSLIFSRAALRRLHADPNRRIKLEYLQRDITRAAGSRREYRYPRHLGALI